MNEQMSEEMAGRLHSASIRLLRQLRREDDETGFSSPRLSALSAIVLTGPISLAELAAAEQVRAPTMSRIVEALVRDGFATRDTLPSDRRSIRIAATEKGIKVLETGRKRRVRVLTNRLSRFAESEKRGLFRGVELLEQLLRS